MLFFRSEDEVQKWCADRGSPIQAVATMEQLWEMAATWYATRLKRESHRPHPDEIRGIFADIGLTGALWDPQTDAFG